MSRIFEDFQIIRPNTASFIPRVSAMLYQHYQCLFLKYNETMLIKEARQKAYEETAALTGGRLRTSTIGTAPTPKEVVTFLRQCLRIPVFEGYGITEAGSITVDQRIRKDVLYKLIGMWFILNLISFRCS